MKFEYGLGYATRKFFDLESSYTCSIPLLSYWGEGGGEIATSNAPGTLRPFSPNPMTPMIRIPSHYVPKRP